MASLYLDDERNPKTKRDWVIVRSYEDAKDYFENNACPEYISFDHDLGTEETGYDVVKMLVEKDLNEKMLYIPKNFEYNVHSANPVGRENISMYILTYLSMRDREREK